MDSHKYSYMVSLFTPFLLLLPITDDLKYPGPLPDRDVNSRS